MKVSNGKLFISALTAVLLVGGPIPASADNGLNCSECHETHTIHPYPDAEETVPCEACHGEPDPNLSVEENHEKIFGPEMESVNSGELCLNCHSK